MDAVELVLLIEELEALHVPGDMAGIRHDLEVRHGCDQAPLLLLEVPLVGERQGRLGLLQQLDRESRRRLALGVEMPGERLAIGGCLGVSQ